MSGTDRKPVAFFVKSIPGARGAAKVSASTTHRWITCGVTAADGSRVRLKAVRVGWCWHTCQEWVDDFFSALSAVPGAPTMRSPAELRRSSEKAARELEAAGA
jgi:hypothetical protein